MFINEIDKQIQEELNKYYEDKNVTGIYKNKELNNMVNRRWNTLNISKKEYLNGLGFMYSTDDFGEKVGEENIESYLNKLYPEKIIPSLNDIHLKKQKVYGFINDYCVKKGISNISYLKQLGFSIQYNYTSKNDVSINDDIRISKSFIFNPFARRNKYNLVVLNKLINSFGIKITDLANMLNVSKQHIDAQIKRKNVVSMFDEEEEDFEDEVEEIVINMINDFDVKYENERQQISVKFHWGKEKGSMVVLYTFHGDLKCVFNPDGIIGDLFNEKKYYKLGKDDIILLKKIKYCNEIQHYERWNGDKEKCRIKNEEIKKIVNKNRKKYKMSEEEYFIFIGFKYYTYNEEVEDRLFDVFKKHLDDEGNVKIPIRLSKGKQNYEYIKANRDLETLGVSKEEIIERFGFKYTRKRKVDRGDIDEKYKKIIESRYIVRENKVYINSQDKFYNNLNNIALRKNTTINNYIKDLGYVRLSKDELPLGYIEYDWRKSNKYNSGIILSKADALLNEISNENNEVYLETNNYEYNTLWKYAYLVNMKLNDLINKCNYRRSYNSNIIRSVDGNNKIKYSIDDIEKNAREEILEELKNLDAVSEKQNTNITRGTRNKKLPKLLKKLYLHKCQLCSQKEGTSSVIETINGVEYVEVHHITKLSAGFNINDESYNTLDYYKNCIVVCCYHHKFLHLHHGGFRKLIMINGKLCFQSEKGDIIEVVTNYHLEPLE